MELLNEVLQLKDLLKKTELVESVHQKEQLMLNDEPTQALIFRYQQAMSFYNDAVRYHLDLDSYQRDLSKAKEELYSSALVKDYLDALRNANEFLKELKDELFDDIIDWKRKMKQCNL